MNNFYIGLLICLFNITGLKTDTNLVQNVRQDSSIQCSEKGCTGTYIGPEFINCSDVAHQFSNKMSAAVGIN